MKSQVRSKLAAVLIGGFVPSALLIAGMNAHLTAAGGEARSKPAVHDEAHSRLLVNASFHDGIDRHAPRNPWLGRIMSSAISIASNL